MSEQKPTDSQGPEQRDRKLIKDARRQVEVARQQDDKAAAAAGHDRPSDTPFVDPKPGAAWVGKRIGAYHIRRVIASGGMGTVFEAVQEHPRRTVAIKLMRRGIASRSALRRFEYESQLLGRLRHPGIAQVYEAGTHDDGGEAVPYFAMEYIPNAKPITEYATQKKLGTRQRLELFSAVCDAVHHGHQKGIIHRDLKPSNILIDSHGQPRVIDFGVARSTDSDMAVTTLQTDVGQLIGTLQYMSPEQCEADPHDIDTRSDVYALGVVFYELLCDQLPYDVRRMAIHEATRVIREQQPTKLSTINRRLRGDVETIALNALEKERERRYRSAAEFGDDIQRYLNSEPIIARPPNLAYQLRIFARKNKALFTATAAVFVVLVAAVVVSTLLYWEADSARREAIEARNQADQSRQAEAEQQQLAEAERNRAFAAEKQQSRERERADQARTEADAAAFLVRIAAGERALLFARELYGADSPEVAKLLHSRAGTVLTRGDRALGDLSWAERLYRKALEIQRSRLGDEHAETIQSLRELVKMLVAQGRFPDAEQLALQFVKGEDGQSEVSAPNRVVIELLGDLYDAWAKPDMATAWRAKLPEPAGGNAPAPAQEAPGSEGESKEVTDD